LLLRQGGAHNLFSVKFYTGRYSGSISIFCLSATLGQEIEVPGQFPQTR
jgi:hypothetical protein